jgi:hypothetical protein
MPEPKTLLDLYGLLVADGNKSVSDVIGRLMRKEVALGTPDLDKVQYRLSTQLVNSISRTAAVENREITGMETPRRRVPTYRTPRNSSRNVPLPSWLPLWRWVSNSGRLGGRCRIASGRRRGSRGSRGCDRVKGVVQRFIGVALAALLPPLMALVYGFWIGFLSRSHIVDFGVDL